MSFDFKIIKEQIEATDAWLRKEYGQLSTGRATPMLLDSIMIDSYGAKQPLKNIANIMVEDARTIRVSPWDSANIKPIESAITAASLPVSLAVDDKGVRVIVPQLTEETRRDLVKLLKKKHEEARVSLRQYRQETEKEIENAEKAGDFAEDEKFRLKEELQKMIDRANAGLDDIFATREKEVMTVS